MNYETMNMKIPTILVVDDLEDNLQVIAQYLEEAEQEYRLFMALEAQKAYQLAHKFNPDLIITDWDMPQMSGIDLIRALKKSYITQNIPVLINTGIHTDSKDLKLALDEGAIDYIRKPMHEIELWARVSSVLRLMRSYEEIEALMEQESHNLEEEIREILNEK